MKFIKSYTNDVINEFCLNKGISTSDLIGYVVTKIDEYQRIDNYERPYVLNEKVYDVKIEKRLQQ